MPKVFISYSWSSPIHREMVKDCADRLLANAVEVILDIYDLREGDDKYAFMERMVTDPQVSHVLMFCDKAYAEKADARRSGVGTESQIISKEVYDRVQQSKFIPVVCERDGENNPYLPTFAKGRIYIDFSTPEAINENWDQLIRAIYGKPLHQKPSLGKRPSFLEEDAPPASPATAKFSAFKQAVLSGKASVALYRKDFLDACIEYADALRTRVQPDPQKWPEKVLADCGALKLVRDQLVDWVLLEASDPALPAFQEALLEVLEQLLELKARPREVTSWNDAWFEAHSVFVYETFLYIVAALLRAKAYGTMHEVLTGHYLQPPTTRYGGGKFQGFECFYGYSESLQAVLAPPGQRLLSPAAALVKKQADRADIPFSAVMEAEVVVMMMAFLARPVRSWFPQTLVYAPHMDTFPFFARATQHRGFEKLAVVTGINDAEKLRAEVKAGMEGSNLLHSADFWRLEHSLPELMNLAGLDKLK